jgi:hypothetical protein
MTFIRIGLAALTAVCTLLAVQVSDINALPDDARGRLVRHGRDLLTMTSAFIGPHAPDRDTRLRLVAERSMGPHGVVVTPP